MPVMNEVKESVVVHEHPPRTLWLHEMLAEGEAEDGEKLRVIMPIPPTCIVVEVGPRTFSVALKEIMDAVLSAIDAGIETPEREEAPDAGESRPD